jgi:hypothetical protein
VALTLPLHRTGVVQSIEQQQKGCVRLRPVLRPQPKQNYPAGVHLHETTAALPAIKSSPFNQPDATI